MYLLIALRVHELLIKKEREVKSIKKMHSFFFLIIILEKNENTLKNVEKNVNNL